MSEKTGRRSFLKLFGGSMVAATTIMSAGKLLAEDEEVFLELPEQEVDGYKEVDFKVVRNKSGRLKDILVKSKDNIKFRYADDRPVQPKVGGASSLEELTESDPYLRKLWDYDETDYNQKFLEMKKMVAEWQREGKTVVAINGVFPFNKNHPSLNTATYFLNNGELRIVKYLHSVRLGKHSLDRRYYLEVI